MRRRILLTSLGSAATISLAGCSEVIENIGQSKYPDPKVRSHLNTSPEPISTEGERDSQQITVENTGVSGNVEISLFWQMEDNPPTSPSTTRPIGPIEGWQLHSSKSMYFDRQERRSTQFNATAPEEAIAYEFVTKSLTYGAEIHNAGSSGDIRAVIETRYDSGDFSGIEDQVVFLNEGETKDVLFNTYVSEETEWRVEAGVPG